MLAILQNRKYYLLVLLAVAAATVFFISRFNSLRFDYDFEAFFPNEDSELELYHTYRHTFGHDNEFVLIAPENRQGIFRQDFLMRIDSLGKALAKVPDVKQVQSPTTLKRLQLDGLVPVSFPLLHINDTSRYRDDSLKVYNNKSLVGSFFPDKGGSLTLFVKTSNDLSKKECDALADSIYKVLDMYRFDEVHVAGRIFAQQVYLEKLQKEFVLFLALSFLLVLIFLWFSFRNFYGVVLPVIVVITGVVWTLGIMAMFHKPIDLMTTMLPTMIFIAGMSDVVHFFSKYFDAQSAGVPREKIFSLILREVGFPTFLTLLTTVVAFLSLLFSSIKPVRDFGIYTSVGISIAFVLTYTLLPALLYFVKPSSLPQKNNRNHGTGRMRSLMSWMFRHQKTILSGTAVLSAFAIAGISRLQINNILLEDLDDSVRIKQDFLFFDEHYSGVRPFEMEVKVTDGKSKILDYDIIRQVNRVDSFIRKNYEPGFLVSPAVFAKELYAGSSGDTSSVFPSREDYNQVLPFLNSNRKNREFRRFMRPDGRKARISGKIRDIGSQRVAELNEKLFVFIGQQTDKAKLSFALTGAAHLIDRNNEYMVDNMLKGFGFSVFVIALLTLLLHRSWRMVLVFILPNLIPLLFIAGIMGYAGIELKAATSIIFSIAFGIATDDTIHFISRLKIERNYGKNILYAFKRTYLETGKPIVLTTFILMGGFLSLTASSFQSTFYFGLLICITVVIALAADLLLLPVLLFALYKDKKE